MLLADLHIHSHYSRATSADCDLPHLDLWARRKGLALVGTGDFTHAAWREQLREQLELAEEGLYRLKAAYCLPEAYGTAPLFVVTGEISCIYKRDGRTRKVHHLILLPGLDAADALSRRLEAIGNLHSDGRPILGLDSQSLLEIVLEVCPEAVFIPAHIWTPHFSVFGAFSAFSTLEECFGSLAGHIHALETGLSSDPPMNWRLSALDGYTLVSNSDAHSPSKLGREANILDIAPSYSNLKKALETGEGFLGTLEFFPEEGKYHLDGHRNCGVCLTPQETRALMGRCPVCGGKLTVGVCHRSEVLADRPLGFHPPAARPFESLVPLVEVIAGSTGRTPAAKATQIAYMHLLSALGSEFYILREAPLEAIAREGGICVAEGIRRLRLGLVEKKPGFDGEFGTITLLPPAQIQALQGQMMFAGTDLAPSVRERMPVAPSPAPEVIREEPQAAVALNPRQQEAVQSPARTLAVQAGPGTGKTGTLTQRIVRLVREEHVPAETLAAVTFTRQAAGELRTRLCAQLGDACVQQMHIGTFHALCLAQLGRPTLVSREQARQWAGEVVSGQGDALLPEKFLQALSRIKNGTSAEEAGLAPLWIQDYQACLQQAGVLDLDDLLLAALQLPPPGFAHLLVDEFQDINPVQYQLVLHWSQNGSLFVIGDPDQAIYGFRGADAQCFARLQKDRPEMTVLSLEDNYRSQPAVVRCALRLMGNTRVLRPHAAAQGPVRMADMDTDLAEGIWIAHEIARMAGGVDMGETQSRKARKEGLRAFSEVAVLARTHRQLEVIEGCLRHDSIPCILRGREAWWEDPEVSSVLAFFRTLADVHDRPALKACLSALWQVPPEDVQKVCAFCATAPGWDALALGDALGGLPSLLPYLEAGRRFLPLFRKEKPEKLLTAWLGGKTPSAAMDKLLHAAVFHESMADLLDAAQAGEEGDLRRASGQTVASGGVELMTLHAAKGLEFPVVFLAGLRRGLLPLERPGQKGDGAEERRLMYVGMTRAREELILTMGGIPSPFLGDLPLEDGVLVREEVRTPRDAGVQLSFF